MTVYAERRHLPQTAQQLFDLVADVERYPEFLPGVTEVRIRDRRDHAILVDMTVAAGPLRKRFSSTGVLDRPHRIDISSDDPLFDRFTQRWTFEPAAEGGTHVEYRIDFEFRSRLLQTLMGRSLADRTALTLHAFKRRASWLYGTVS
jgi:coenzyme Q-binding protein COQ10